MGTEPHRGKVRGALPRLVDWLACPVCRRRGELDQPLAVAGNSLVCPQRHCLDVARDGHVTMTTHRAGANADTAAMVAARQRVLDAGIFDPLDDALTAILSGRTRLCEVGAGTGHHLSRVLSGDPEGRSWGLATDVSPAAVRVAARAHPRMAAVVADTWAGLPLRTGALDALVCVFAPRHAPEFARVLAPGGLLVTATPGPGHLAQLRERGILIGMQSGKQQALEDSLAPHLEVVERRSLHHEVWADAGLVADIVAMGPSAHHRRDLARPTGCTVDVEVEVTTFAPAPTPPTPGSREGSGRVGGPALAQQRCRPAVGSDLAVSPRRPPPWPR